MLRVAMTAMVAMLEQFHLVYGGDGCTYPFTNDFVAVKTHVHLLSEAPFGKFTDSSAVCTWLQVEFAILVLWWSE